MRRAAFGRSGARPERRARRDGGEQRERARRVRRHQRERPRRRLRRAREVRAHEPRAAGGRARDRGSEVRRAIRDAAPVDREKARFGARGNLLRRGRRPRRFRRARARTRARRDHARRGRRGDVRGRVGAVLPGVLVHRRPDGPRRPRPRGALVGVRRARPRRSGEAAHGVEHGLRVRLPERHGLSRRAVRRAPRARERRSPRGDEARAGARVGRFRARVLERCRSRRSRCSRRA